MTDKESLSEQSGSSDPFFAEGAAPPDLIDDLPCSRSLKAEQSSGDVAVAVRFDFGAWFDRLPATEENPIVIANLPGGDEELAVEDVRGLIDMLERALQVHAKAAAALEEESRHQPPSTTRDNRDVASTQER